MQVSNQSGLENSDSQKPINWPEIIAALMRSTFKFKSFEYQEAPSTKKHPQDPLCMMEHFMQGQVTNVSVFDKNNQQYKIGDPINTPLENIARAVIHVEHIDIEYIPFQNNTAEAITATGLQYDFKSEDQEESHKAGLEKAKAALNLAYTAKAMGWTKVNFGNTSDPVERQLLIKACQHVGLDFGEEKMWSSSQPETKIEDPKSWEALPAVQQTRDTINANKNITEEQKKMINPVFIMADNSFNAFMQNPTAPIGSKATAQNQAPSNHRPPTNTSQSAATSLGM